MPATLWMNLDNIMLSERSQSQKNINIVFHVYELSRIGKSMEKENKTVVFLGFREIMK